MGGRGIGVTIDHVVYGAPDLERAIDAIEARTGVRAAFGGKHRGAGTHNALLGLGERCYLEIVAPDPEQEAPTARPMPFGVGELAEGRVVAWAHRVDDVGTTVARARRMGYDPGDAHPMSRETPDGQTLAWTLTRPPDGVRQGAIPFLIDWGDTRHPSEAAPGGCSLVRLRGEHPNAPDVLDALLAVDAMDLTVIPGPEPRLVAIMETPRGTVELE